jgi:acyl carrier protein
MTDSLRTHIDNAVKEFISQYLVKNGWKDETVNDQTDPFNSGMLDSLALAELLAYVEEKAGQEIDFLMIDPEELGSVKSIVDAFTQAASEPA